MDVHDHDPGPVSLMVSLLSKLLVLTTGTPIHTTTETQLDNLYRERITPYCLPSEEIPFSGLDS